MPIVPKKNTPKPKIQAIDKPTDQVKKVNSSQEIPPQVYTAHGRDTSFERFNIAALLEEATCHRADLA